MTDQAIIECSDMVKNYGKVRALDRVDLHLARGEILCLLGPSGCGKTTTLRVIAGLEELDEGSVKLGGRTVGSARVHVPPERRNVGVVFQDFALFPHMNVQQNVRYGLHRSGSPSSRVDEVLDLVGLDGYRDRMPHELSGGQQQRVALARALGPRPEVVLFDEPFSNLDAGLRERLRAEVRRILREAGTSAIFVTHDQQEALSLADRVAVMWDGKILQNAPPHQIYCQPATRMVASFVGQANFLPADVRAGSVVCELGIYHHGVGEGCNGDMHVMFRPEELTAHPHKQGNARVLSREYYGDTQMVQVELDSGSVLCVRLDPEASMEVGGRVSVAARTSPVVYSEDGCAVGGRPMSCESRTS